MVNTRKIQVPNLSFTLNGADGINGIDGINGMKMVLLEQGDTGINGTDGINGTTGAKRRYWNKWY
jgi:hypothetical protein